MYIHSAKIFFLLLFRHDNYPNFPPEAFVFNAMGLIITFYGLLVLYLVNEPLYKRTSIPEDELALTGQE